MATNHTNDNRIVGNRFEDWLCERLFCAGFWAHNMAQRAAGQPADIITARDGKTYLIDAKVCKGDSFQLSRIEPNQHSAMELWKSCYGETGWFAIRFGNDCTYMVSYDEIAELMAQGKTRILQVELASRHYGHTLNWWLTVQ